MRRLWLVIPLAALALASCGGDDEPAPPAADDLFDSNRAFSDLEAQVEIGPRPSRTAGNREAVDFITATLNEAGAEGIQVQRPWRNVVATIPGKSPGTVIVAAHHDTKDIPGFVGANDGASGVAVVLGLARGLAAQAPLDGPSIQFVLFDAEEARGNRDFGVDGLRGSLQYVDYARRAEQGSVPLDGIQAMVLFDMVGDCDLEIPRETLSDEALYDEFADASVEINAEPAPFEGTGGGVVDDHIPFRDQGIPAVDFIDFQYGPGSSPGEYWHTADDTLDKVCPESLDAVGEVAMRAIPEIR